MSHSKNYAKILNQLNFNFPGLPKLPRAPDVQNNRDLVDVYIAKRRLELVHLLPSIDVQSLRQRASQKNDTLEQAGNLDHNFLSSLLASGHSSVVNELVTLAKEEEPLLTNSHETGRYESFTEDKSRLDILVQGLISCSEAEKSDKVSEKVRARKALGEKMVLLGDFWLARKMFIKSFSYIEFYNDDEQDKMRVELWCLLSYICIYHEESQQIGYNLPTKCLTLAQQICRDQSWYMKKSVLSILVPQVMNVYGLRNDWSKIKADWVNMYTVVTTLLHVLYVKKARYWQEELLCLEKKDKNLKNKEAQRKWIKENISETLTSALAYADDVRQYQAFIATTLRRGLFFEEQGDKEKAMEDFNAMLVLALNFDEKEAVAIALNRIGHNYKLSKKALVALEHFVNQLDVSSENDLEELKADALQDLGIVLLEEGHTWEADECISQANGIFRETKQADTPNNLDDMSWALMGITRGQHLWGRYTTLIRTQQRSNIHAVYDWKMSRKGFPLASMPPKWYKTQLRSDFDKHYEGVMPRPHRHRHRKSEWIKERETTVDRVQFDVPETDTDTTRRLFEFTPSEVGNRQSIWLRNQGFNNIFGFINASDKPRFIPADDNLDMSLSEIRMKAEDDDDTFHKKRRNEAIRRDNNLGLSFRKSIRATFTGKGMADWIKHDVRQKAKKRRLQSMDRWKVMTTPTMGFGARLRALLDDMEDITAFDDDDDVNKFFDMTDGEEEDESEDPELIRDDTKRSRMNSALLEEFLKFDEKQLGF